MEQGDGAVAIYQVSKSDQTKSKAPLIVKTTSTNTLASRLTDKYIDTYESSIIQDTTNPTLDHFQPFDLDAW